MHDPGQIVGDMVGGVILVIVVAVGLWAIHEIAAACHRWRQDRAKRWRRLEGAPHVRSRRPMPPGPMWVNHRLYEDWHRRGHISPPPRLYLDDSLPEVRPADWEDDET